MADAKLKVRLLTYTPDGEKIVASAAKLCYARADIDTVLEGLTPEKTKEFLEMLTNLGHASPIEHISFTFGIENVSRALLAQITRHRLASFSVQSQRYVAEDGFDFVLPPAIEANAEAKALYLETMDELSARYTKLTELLMEGTPGTTADKKKAIEDARFVLPNGCTTKMMVTMNARSLLNFFNLRCCNRAQWEIRELATQMLMLVREVCPTIFRYAGPPCVAGKCPEGKMTCGKANEMKEKFLGA
ncbi:MAG: FAD-dependent thymidylate synthase [Clostridia bacterium]|nr:FAD-dependent thymidylate synthase [Clostridia bacterium]